MGSLQTNVRFTCPACGGDARSFARVPEPSWGASDKISDCTSEDQTEVVCNLCDTWFPAYVLNTSSGCVISLDDYPGTKTNADYAFFSGDEDSEFQDYILADPPSDPMGIFLKSYHQVSDILKTHGGASGDDLINRMAFGQLVTAMEAYLSDRFAKKVLSDSAARLRLVQADPDLRKEKFSLPEIASTDDIVYEKVREFLVKTSFHNLIKVADLYKQGLSIDIWENDQIKRKLLKAVELRHHHVHRNGFDLEGKPIVDYTQEYVREIADVIKTFLYRIENQLIEDIPF